MDAGYRKLAQPKWEDVFKFVSSAIGILLVASIAYLLLIICLRDGALFTSLIVVVVAASFIYVFGHYAYSGIKGSRNDKNQESVVSTLEAQEIAARSRLQTEKETEELVAKQRLQVEKQAGARYQNEIQHLEKQLELKQATISKLENKLALTELKFKGLAKNISSQRKSAPVDENYRETQLSTQKTSHPVDKKHRAKNLSSQSNSARLVETCQFHIAGVSHKNSCGTSRQIIVPGLRMGDSLNIEREPNNAFDPNAFRVVSKTGQVGYVPKSVVSDLAGKGLVPAEAKVISVGKANNGLWGCAVEAKCIERVQSQGSRPPPLKENRPHGDDIADASRFHNIPADELIKLLKKPFNDFENFPRGFSKSGDFSIKQSKILEQFGRSFLALQDGIDLTGITLHGMHLAELVNSPDKMKAWEKYSELTKKPNIKPFSQADVRINEGSYYEDSSMPPEHSGWYEAPNGYNYDGDYDYEVDNGYKDDDDYS